MWAGKGMNQAGNSTTANIPTLGARNSISLLDNFWQRTRHSWRAEKDGSSGLQIKTYCRQGEKGNGEDRKTGGHNATHPWLGNSISVADGRHSDL